MNNKDNIKYWTGGKVILDLIKKKYKGSFPKKKFKIWRPEKIEILNGNTGNPTK